MSAVSAGEPARGVGCVDRHHVAERARRGLAYVADVLIRDELEAGTLVPVLGEHVGTPVECHVVWPPTRHIPPKLRVFIDYIAEHLLPDTRARSRR